MTKDPKQGMPTTHGVLVKGVETISNARREFGVRLMAMGAVGVFVSGCAKTPKLACATREQLSMTQAIARSGRQYVERSPSTTKNCSNCAHYSAATVMADNGSTGQILSGCGVCGIDAMAANPNGYCMSWAVITT